MEAVLMSDLFWVAIVLVIGFVHGCYLLAQGLGSVAEAIVCTRSESLFQIRKIIEEYLHASKGGAE